MKEERKEILMEEIQQEIKNIKQEIEETKSETRKEYLQCILKEKEEIKETLYFTPTEEDIKDMKYWL